MADERWATTVRLSPAVMLWLKIESVKRRCSQQDVILASLVAAGAPDEQRS